MRYLSVCSGIEAATVAWHPLGFTPVAFSDIEPFPSAVLAHHYPNVPNYGDMTQYEKWPIKEGEIDLLVGGTPCQSFSVAGFRGGLLDPRGALMLSYIEIARRLKPRWIVWENVPGVLSSNGGRDFGSFLGALGDMGYGWAYRVLDAQWIRTQQYPLAVPQRRRRVFVVGCLGDTTSAGQVLFKCQSVQRDSTSRKQKGQEAPGDLGGSAPSVCAKWSKGTGGPSGDECQNLIAGYRWVNNRQGFANDGTIAALRASSGESGFHEMNHPIIMTPYVKSRRAQSVTDYETWIEGECAPTQNLFDVSDTRATTVVANDLAVRRLTPVECERLQGFPDKYTEIPWRKKPADQCPDGPRYKAIGNSMSVNCMEWIGRRIAEVNASNYSPVV